MIRAALAAALLAGRVAAAPAPAKPAAAAATPGVGTATEYRAGAPIAATLTGSLTISPLVPRLKSDPLLPLPGARVTIVLSVSKSGASPVTGLRPVLALVGGSEFCGPLAGPLPAGPVTSAPNGVSFFTWTVSITAPGPVRVRATVTATVTGQGGVAAVTERDICPPALARLAASLDPERLPVQAGRWFSVSVTVSNTGGTKAAGILPAVQPVEGAKLVTLIKGPVPAKSILLGPGESGVFTFSYSANGSGRVVFSATVSGVTDLSPPGILSRTSARTGTLVSEGAAWTAARARELSAKAKLLLFPPQPPPPTEAPLTSFERPGEERWETDGYATVALSATHVTDGAASLAATFLVPADLTASATGSFRPTLALRALARGRDAALPVRDWTGFTAVSADLYAAAAAPLQLTLALVDSRGYRWEQVRQVPAGSATTLRIELADPGAARLDLSRVAALELGVETSGLKARPTLWLDHLRFALPPAPPAAPLPAGAMTAPQPPPTSTVLADSGTVRPAGTRTGTGRAAP